jgi:hypothetical protein
VNRLNGDSPGVEMNLTGQRHPNRERMEELCCFMALGELSFDESRELAAHLQTCAECRKLLSDFERIALKDLPLVVASRIEGNLDSVPRDLDVQTALSRVLSKVGTSPEVPEESKRPDPIIFPKPARRIAWLKPVAIACTAAALAVTASLAYRNRQVHSRMDISVRSTLQADVSYWKDRSTFLSGQTQSLQSKLAQSQQNLTVATNTLNQERDAHAKVLLAQKNLQDELTARASDAEEKARELREVQTSLAQEQNGQRALLDEVQHLRVLSKEQSEIIASLSQHANEAEKNPVPPPPNVTEAEALSVFGARNLEIVDVVDVNSGDKKPKIFGRVYYVDRRLLLFYAFDLQDHKHGRMAAGFQAWGFRQPNSAKAESLGLFYVDDASLNRWVLKVTDPKVLASIDTVFVTAEPPGGSLSPKGKKLLLASIANPPNHP